MHSGIPSQTRRAAQEATSFSTFVVLKRRSVLNRHSADVVVGP